MATTRDIWQVCQITSTKWNEESKLIFCFMLLCGCLSSILTATSSIKRNIRGDNEICIQEFLTCSSIICSFLHLSSWDFLYFLTFPRQTTTTNISNIALIVMFIKTWEMLDANLWLGSLGFCLLVFVKHIHESFSYFKQNESQRLSLNLFAIMKQ